jgi:hypothetical protein
MNYSFPYMPQTERKSPQSCFVSMLTGFIISIAIGVILGFFGSLCYALINQSGGLEWLTVPIVIILVIGTVAIYFLLLLFDHKIIFKY